MPNLSELEGGVRRTRLLVAPPGTRCGWSRGAPEAQRHRSPSWWWMRASFLQVLGYTRLSESQVRCPFLLPACLGFGFRNACLSLHPFLRSTGYGAQDFQCWMRNHLTKTLRSWVWAIQSHCFRYSGCWLSRSWSVSPRELPVSLNFKHVACCTGSLNHMLPQLLNILCLKKKAEIEVTYNGTKSIWFEGCVMKTHLFG